MCPILHLRQKLEEGFHQGLYPPTWEGYFKLSADARLIGSNCRDFNKGLYSRIGKEFLKLTDEIIEYQAVKLVPLLGEQPSAKTARGGRR